MALAAARALRFEQPAAVATTQGDMESADWWERHEELFEHARLEWGAACKEIYHLRPLAATTSGEKDASRPSFLSRFRSDMEGGGTIASSKWLVPSLRSALACKQKEFASSILEPVCTDSAGFSVYKFDLFTDEFCDTLLSELDHLEASEIPLRRPNGMNRYGAILSNLGFQQGLLEPLMKEVALPLARQIWPEWVGETDCDDTYGFSVRYKMGEDLALAEHADTSNVTLNVCLGRVFEGGNLYFKGVRFTDSAGDQEQRLVEHKKGSALLHLGGHFHAALPITAGERSNLILWGTGPGGVVRIRPDSPRQFSIAQRPLQCSSS